MAHPRIDVKDNERWGKLVKTWATGKNYVDYIATEDAPVPSEVELRPTYPKPTSFQDFVAQCVKANVGLVFKDGKDTPVNGNEGLGFVLLQATSDTSVLRLPASEKIAESEAKLVAAEPYPLPPFYGRVFGKNEVPAEITPSQIDTNLKRLALHAERIGEYTINTCH